MTQETVTIKTTRCDFCREICSGEDYKIRVVMGYALADPVYIEGELRSHIPCAKPSSDICKKCADKALKRHLGIEDSDKLIAAAPELRTLLLQIHAELSHTASPDADTGNWEGYTLHRIERLLWPEGERS